MSPYTRAVLFVIRMTAFALVLIGALYLASDFIFAARTPGRLGLLPVFLKVLLLATGLVLWIRSYPIARRLTKGFDE